MPYKLIINEPYDVYLSFYPSFIYPLFEIRKKDSICILKKTIGMYKCSTISIKDNTVYFTGVNNSIVQEWLGLWFKPWLLLNEVDRKYLGFIENLVEKFSSIRIAISGEDKPWVFLSVFLSRNTSFHTNTVKWIRKIGSIEPINPFNIDPANVGGSYQLKQLAEILKTRSIVDKLVTLISRISTEKDAWKARANLLKIKYVGPKTVDAFLLFTTRYSFFTPSDRHYKSFIQSFLDRKLNLPLKKYCLRYTCFSCPYNGSCLTGWSISSFGRLSGWIQTLSYLYGNNKIAI
ncbi:hypothetical protein J4526_01030 [Desulfurococcaceae archaeon MEX13E-LK6-19]|nr:hypothetical protein J4526_01030 [Desulfurococcaceae archaeon MEX13E-LK6-19]